MYVVVSKQPVTRIVIASKLLVVGHDAMDRVMAVATDRQGFHELLACKSFLEPFVGMTLARNQVVFGRAQSWFATA